MSLFPMNFLKRKKPVTASDIISVVDEEIDKVIKEFDLFEEVDIELQKKIDDGVRKKLNQIKTDPIIIEALAAIEHSQWTQWTDFMLDNYTSKNIAKWRLQIKTPYSNLSLKERESDKRWVKQILDVICGE